MFFPIGNISENLFSLEHREGDVTILIGENGSGKSQLLSNLAKEYISSRKKVIAISNSIYDKFPESDYSKRLFLLRDRRGREKVKAAVKGALANILPGDLKRFKNISETLEFVGYDPVIGIGQLQIASDYLDKFTEEFYRENLGHPFASKYEYDELRNLIYELNHFHLERVMWLSFLDYSFEEVKQSFLLQIFKWEHFLRKTGAINEIRVYLRKDNKEINLYDASSGELNFISSLLFITTIIDDNTIVLIDEPENSLHPKWQKEFVEVLMSRFYLYQPKVFIATHSVLIVTGAEISTPTTNVYIGKEFVFTKKLNEPINIEQAFMDYFEVVTPENRFLSNHLVDLLNRLAEKRISIEVLNLELNKLSDEAYQDDQKRLFQGVRLIAQKIIEKRGNNNV